MAKDDQPSVLGGIRGGAALPDRDPIRTLLLQLLWCLEYASPTAAHHADTARVCSGLGIQPIVFGPRLP